MTENSSSESELQERFQALRKQEAALAPSFDQITTMAYRQSNADAPSRIVPVLLPLSAAALFCLVATVLLKNSKPEPGPLSSTLPVLLESDPARVPLFAGIEGLGETRRYLSDRLLPVHLRIRL